MEYELCFKTPIQNLKEKINGNRIFIKRDDLIPYSFGGNKARKAFYFFEEIIREKCDCVLTYGSSSSNHCRVITNLAASNRLRCIIVSPEEKNIFTYNSKMSELLGAEIVYCQLSDVKDTIDDQLKKLHKEGQNPYFILGGGHGNLGTKAYVEAYEEIISYEFENNLYFDYIFHTSGTGTTQAGLICGQIIHDDDRKIIGISNARKNPYGSRVILGSVNEYLESIGHSIISNDLVNLIDDYVLDGYKSYNERILKTVREVFIQEGVPLDPIYTGKGFWGMKEYIKINQVKNKNILFIHTGGTPLFFDYLEEIINERTY